MLNGCSNVLSKSRIHTQTHILYTCLQFYLMANVPSRFAVPVSLPMSSHRIRFSFDFDAYSLYEKSRRRQVEKRERRRQPT